MSKSSYFFEKFLNLFENLKNSLVTMRKNSSSFITQALLTTNNSFLSVFDGCCYVCHIYIDFLSLRDEWVGDICFHSATSRFSPQNRKKLRFFSISGGENLGFYGVNRKFLRNFRFKSKILKSADGAF